MRAAAAVAAALAAAIAAPGALAQPGRPLMAMYEDEAALAAACNEGLARTRAALAAMQARPGAGSILKEWNGAYVLLDDFSNPIDFYAAVHPKREVRAAAEACQQKVAELNTEIFQNEKLYARVKAVKPANPRDAKYRRDLLDGFEDSGVALAPAKRARAKQIFERIESLRQEFERNAREDPAKVTFTPAEMEGLPQAYLQRRKPDAQGNYLLGLDQPSYGPFMENAKSEAARERYYRARFAQGGTRNLAVLEELFTLRKELAGLYGLPTFADYGLRRKMAQKPQNVDKFLREVKAAVAEVEKGELDELGAAKAKEKPDGAAVVRPWDVQYYQEVVRRQRFDVDQEALRKYFPADKSVEFALLVAQRLYGVKFTEAGAPTWHPDVRYFEMTGEKDGRYRGALYVDLFPRDGKRAGAFAGPVRTASKLAHRTPLAVLVANFDRGGFNQRELEVLFHELGHALHGLLADVDYALHGSLNVKWDFVEAPSQMFEEWARREQSLELFRQVCPECPRLTREQIERIDAARRFGAGVRVARQWTLATFDMELSRDPRPPLAAWKQIESAGPLGHVEGTMFPSSFRHIAGGYAAGYYGYMWSQVIALDMLSPFKADMLDPAVGARYRDAILAPGGQGEEGAMVRKFLGRDASNAAFLAEITGKR
jgi:Zn-dependent oligopeptidase